jgi:hypothetical protein
VCEAKHEPGKGGGRREKGGGRREKGGGRREKGGVVLTLTTWLEL